jgi:hypothetical protein
MQGHFLHLRFKTFPMTLRTPWCEVFWALLSSSEHSGVPEDSKSSLFSKCWASPPHLAKVGLRQKPSSGFHPVTWKRVTSLGKLCWCKCSWLLHRRWTLLFLDKTCPSFCCIIISSSSFFSNSSIEKLITWTNCRPPNDPFLSISLSVSETEEDMHPIPNIEGVMGGGPLIKTAVKSLCLFKLFTAVAGGWSWWWCRIFPSSCFSLHRCQFLTHFAITLSWSGFLAACKAQIRILFLFQESESHFLLFLHVC